MSSTQPNRCCVMDFLQNSLLNELHTEACYISPIYPIMVIDPLQGLRTEIRVPSPIKLILNITSDSTRTAIVFFPFLRTFITLWAGFSAHYQLNPTCFHLQQFFQKNLKTNVVKTLISTIYQYRHNLKIILRKKERKKKTAGFAFFRDAR